MIELLLFIMLIAVGIAVLGALLKLIFALLLLPFKAALWFTKGLIGLVIAVPVILVVWLIAANVIPIVLFALLLPVVLFIAGMALLLRLIV